MDNKIACGASRESFILFLSPPPDSRSLAVRLCVRDCIIKASCKANRYGINVQSANFYSAFIGKKYGIHIGANETFPARKIAAFDNVARKITRI
jgi:hypothetical protein